jgi:protein gp37
VATRSSIEWTDATWNPVTGCSKVSPGCKHCYAEHLAAHPTIVTKTRNK